MTNKILRQLMAADDWQSISGEERYRRFAAACDEWIGRHSARDAAAMDTNGGAFKGSAFVNDTHDISVGQGHGRSMGHMPSVPIVPGVPLSLVRQIAVDAEADERTAAQFLLGEPIRVRALRERLEAAAGKHAAVLDSAKTEIAISRINKASDIDPGMKAAAVASLRGTDAVAEQLAGRGRGAGHTTQLRGRDALLRRNADDGASKAQGAKNTNGGPIRLTGRSTSR